MNYRKIVSAVALLWCTAGFAAGSEPAACVRPMMGTGAAGCVVPVAAAPFGMVQLGPDTYFTASGYHYDHPLIYGFSHTHKSGGGGTDYQDIMFFPVTDAVWTQQQVCPDRVGSRYSHEQEFIEPGYYRIRLDSDVDAELTATARCGMHRYTYPEGAMRQLIIDLKHGCEHSTTIFADEDFDTVKISRLEWVDDRTVRGYRVSNGWAPEQHVYFYAEFSEPIVSCRLFDHKHFRDGVRELEGTDVRAVLRFGGKAGKPVVVRVGISPVSMDGARQNLRAEIKGWNFDKVRKTTYRDWNEALSAVRIADADSPQKEVFYTSLYFAMLYPMLYSDVTGEYRSSDSKVYKGDFRYFAGVLGLWDTFRAQNPLIAILRPDVTRDLMKTLLEHYRHCGQLPIWTLAGVENMCMIGYHSMPLVADAYCKGIRGYDAEALYEAMKASANRDTFGYFLKAFRGTRYYKQYEYVPCDLEVTSVSKTLEYCYDDWCIAQVAKKLGKTNDAAMLEKASQNYKNLFDPETRLMRGRNADGTFQTPFSPYKWGDAFTEGNAWHYTWSVFHDVEGLIDLMGGHKGFTRMLDSVFVVPPVYDDSYYGFRIHEITEMQVADMGNYAHGNQPAQHMIYLYNYAGAPWKAQYWAREVMDRLYSARPDGYCGDEDNGQTSAWYVFSALGFYPVCPASDEYVVGSPLFRKAVVNLENGNKIVLEAPDNSPENRYIGAVQFDGKSYTHNFLRHSDLVKGAGVRFSMRPEPDYTRGTEPGDAPYSFSRE